MKKNKLWLSALWLAGIGGFILIITAINTLGCGQAAEEARSLQTTTSTTNAVTTTATASTTTTSTSSSTSSTTGTTTTSTTTTTILGETTTYSSGIGTVEGTAGFDLDEGIGYPEVLNSDRDIRWQQQTEVLRYLETKNDSLLYVAGAIDFDNVSYESIIDAPLSSEAIDGSNNENNQIPNNTVIYAKTSENRYSKFEILNYGYDLTIQWETYQPGTSSTTTTTSTILATSTTATPTTTTSTTSTTTSSSSTTISTTTTTTNTTTTSMSASGFAIWVVDGTNAAVGKYCSLAFDSNYYAHISYYDDYYDNLKFATNSSGFWNAETVDSTNQTGLYTSIAFSDDDAYISYYYATGGNLKFCNNSPGEWRIDTADPSVIDNIGNGTSLAINLGKVHISYVDTTNNNLKYATIHSSTWETEVVDNSGNIGNLYTSIAVDGNRKTHIVYYDSNDNIKYATGEAGSWTISTIAAGTYPSLALDNNGKAHISYMNDSNQSLSYITNASGSWESADADPQPNTGAPSSIALDSNGKAHISYRRAGGAARLEYATNRSGNWQLVTVDDTSGVGSYNSIAINSSNQPCIAYYDPGNFDLKYAVKQ